MNATTRKSVSMVEAKAKANIKERYSSEDIGIWDEACAAAGLDTEMGIPVQGQRHLIASWAGVKAAVTYIISATRSERRSFETETREESVRNKELNNTIEALRKQLDKAKDENRRLEKELLGKEIHDVVSQNAHNDQLVQLVDAKLAS